MKTSRPVCLITIVALFPLGICVSLGNLAAAQNDEPTSKNNDQLAKWLDRFPQADANKDGVLTMSEARDFRQKKQRGGQVKRIPATHEEVAYGPNVRHKLDLWLPESEKPTPLIIYIHGGGFVGGNRKNVNGSLIDEAHKHHFAVASISYRFVTTDPFPAPQHDGIRAIQFLRANAKKWNLDPKKFAVFGGSAGAGISMYIGYHDDFANPKSDDPIERVSSRVIAVGSLGGQSSYDPFVIQKWIGGRAHEHPSIYKCYDVKTLDELKKPELQKMYDEVSAIKHVTRDDPPTIMFYSEPDKPLPANARPGQGIHHPIFGQKLKAELEKHNIKAVYHHSSTYKGNSFRDLVTFFRSEFEK